MTASSRLLCLLALGPLLAASSSSLASAAGDAVPAAPAAVGDATGRDPYMTTTFIRFRDVAEDARSVLDGLSAAEAAEVRQLIQTGDDLVARVREVNRTDHVARWANLRSLNDVTDQLKALHRTGSSSRTEGRPFVPADRTPTGWVQVEQEQAGLSALRVRFARPGSAWVVLQNGTDAPLPFFVQIDFTDHVGDPTGSATAESVPGKELKPGEVRSVLAPITPSQSRFWDVTRGWSLRVE